jgi:flagellar biosynthesis protein FlhG
MIISITGGKGGTGKTTVAINASIILSQLNKKVLLVDCDFGSGKCHGYLGTYSFKNISDLLKNEPIEKIIVKKHGIDFIDNPSGDEHMANMTNMERNIIIDNIVKVSENYDFVILDTSAGIGANVTSLLRISDQVFFVVQASNRESIIDSYQLAKKTILHNKEIGINFIMNMSDRELGGRQFVKLYNNCNNFLNKETKCLGHINKTKDVNRAITESMPFFVLNPHSKLSKQMILIVKEFLK